MPDAAPPMMDPVLVFGATGDQGRPLIRRLAARNYRVRAATRTPAAFPREAFPGVEPVAADVEDEASIERVARGVRAILMHLPFTFDRDQARRMGRAIAGAARAAGVERIVFHTSCVVADHDLGIAGHDARRDIEAELARSGARTVFVRSAVFMDNMIRVWAKPSIVDRGIFAYPCTPELGISWIDQADIAAYMIAACEAADPPATLLVGGPEVLTGDEVAARLSLAIGRPIGFRSLHPDEFAAGMSELVTGSAAYAPGSIYDWMADFYRWYNAQPVSPLAVDLRPALAVLPVRPTPLLVWARRQDWSSGRSS